MAKKMFLFRLEVTLSAAAVHTSHKETEILGVMADLTNPFIAIADPTQQIREPHTDAAQTVNRSSHGDLGTQKVFKALRLTP